MASKRGRGEKEKKKKKPEGQVEKGQGKEETERSKERGSIFSGVALPTCLSTLLSRCQHAPLQTQLQVTKSSHCPTQGVFPMSHTANYTGMPNASKEGN